MKKLLLAFCLLLPGFPVKAQDQNIGDTQSLLSVPGMAQAAADFVKSMKAVGLLDLKGNLGGGTMLPLRQLHDAEGINYAAAGIGGLIKQQEHFRPRFVFLCDSSAIIRRLERQNVWYSNHVSSIKLPDFWLGPNIQIPFPGDNFQWKDWRRYLGGAVSIGF